MSKIIACDIHDHFEIVCMRRSQVKLELMDRSAPVEGIAADLITSDEKREYLILESDGHQLQIDLLSIKRMEIIDENKTIDIQ